MPRIYFDSNIYRYFKKTTDKKLLELQDFIKNKDQLHVFFSSAHLFDLGRDKTHHKYEDLSFMEQFTGHNYIHLNKDEDFVVTQLATPAEAFERINPDPFQSSEYNEILDILKGNVDDPKIRNLMDTALNLPIGQSFEDLADMDETSKESLGFYLPELTKGSTVRDLVIGMLDKFKGFHEDPKLWRRAIRSSQQGLQLKQNYDIDLHTINFNQELKKTPLATTFIDFVKKIEGFQNPKEEQKEHGFHIAAYNALNILGLDSEKKINFASSLDDANHSFYAAHCDYFVVEDKQLRIKSKVLYKLIGINTKVLSLNEFKEELTLIKFSSSGISAEELLKRVSFELKHAFILDTPSSFVYPRTYVKYKLTSPILLYFNRMDEVKDDKDGHFLVLYKEQQDYSRFIAYKEIEILTNSLSKIFGADHYFKKEFTEKDKAEVKANLWQGRNWNLGKIKVVFEKNEGTKKLSLLIYPEQTLIDERI